MSRVPGRARAPRDPGPTPSPAPEDPTEPVPPAFGARLMTPLLLGAVLNPVNSTMIATALVAIGRTFHVGAADTAWLVASLYLASAVAQPTLGKLADALGPRRVLLGGFVLVATAGAVGTLAPAFGWLIASRVLLGIGTSAAYPCAMALLRTEAERLDRPVPRTVLARLSLASLGSAAVGPVLGGLLAATLGWRAIFAVNVPVALLGLLLAALWLPRDTAERTRARSGGVDPLGIALFGASLTVAMLFLMDLHRPRWLLLVPFTVLAALLVRWQLRHPRPFLDLRMLARHRPLVRTYLRHGLAYLVIYCVMYGFAQWLEESPGLSSFHAGLVLLPMSLAAAACSLLGARTKGIRGPLVLAAALLLAGSGALALAHGSTPLAVLLLASVLFGLPQGLAGTGNQAAVATQAPADGMGAAAGLQRTAQYLGAITASSLLALFYGERADDEGLHRTAITVAALSLALLVLTVTDRALRGRSSPPPDAARPERPKTPPSPHHRESLSTTPRTKEHPMPVTTLDPRTALVLIDLQKGITGMPSAHPMQEIVDRSARLASAFRHRRLPVVLVNVTGGAPGRTEAAMGGGGERPADWAELRPELDAQEGDILITKERWGAFHGTALDRELRRRDVTQIVLGGVATSFGVESTARAAHEHGYHVTVVSDAVTGPEAEAHRHSMESVFPRLGETGTTEEILALLPS